MSQLVLGFAIAVSAQEPKDADAPQPEQPLSVARVLGEVTSIEVAEHRLTVKPDSGESVALTTSSATTCLRTQPGVKDLHDAVTIGCDEIGVGDRVFARGVSPSAGQAVTARQIVIMARDDLLRKREQERAEWRRRGIAGVVKALDPRTKKATLEVRSLSAAQEIVVDATERKALFLRYATGSASFGDAKPSSFEELRIGDQMRALGGRTPDGSRFLAEKIVSGAFRTVAGKVRTIHPEASEVTIDTLTIGERKPETLAFVLGPEALLRRLPDEMAQRLLAQRNGQHGRRPGGVARDGASRERDGQPGWDRDRAPMGRSWAENGAPSLSDLFERMPAIAIADLTPNEYVAVAMAVKGNGRRVQAIKLLAGVEPLLRESSAPRSGAMQGQAPGLTPGTLDLDLGMGFPE